jgi:hypothetical protein
MEGEPKERLLRSATKERLRCGVEGGVGYAGVEGREHDQHLQKRCAKRNDT